MAERELETVPGGDSSLGVQRFETTVENVDGACVVAIRGELDIATSPGVRGVLDEAAGDGARPLVIDLSRCEFIDSTGLAVLLHGAKPAQDGESHLAIVSPDGELRRLLELTAIDQAIPVHDSREEAVAAVMAIV
jgi:anti-sigma B factor antagonist